MPSKLPHYALRIPTPTMDKLKYIAEYNGRSANKEIEQLILAHIAKFEKEHGEINLDGFSPRSKS
ncbi:MAG: Arc family DNA-binding protein [Lachnospiraceae bacterium]|jgi:predicted DNA-binding protein|nr:Arc family DNA-binding protein [Lachnospiraceae bacterium]